MFCSNCGKFIKENIKKCPRCNEIIESEEKISELKEEIEKPIKSKKSLLILSAFSIYFTIGAIMLLFQKRIDFDGYPNSYIISYYVGSILIQIVLSTIAIFKTMKERKIIKSKLNTINLYLNISIIGLNIVVFIISLIIVL